MNFVMPQWQVACQLPGENSPVYTFSVTDDDIDGFCRTLRVNNVQAYTVTPIAQFNNQFVSIKDLPADEDCGCGKKK